VAVRRPGSEWRLAPDHATGNGVSTVKKTTAGYLHLTGQATHTVLVCSLTLLAHRTSEPLTSMASLGLTPSYSKTRGTWPAVPAVTSSTGRSDAGGIASFSPPGGVQKTCTPLNSPPSYE
jgi:hypothetical protein